MTEPSFPVRKVGPSDLVAGHPTPGMDRQEAVATDGMWTGLVHTHAGMASGWHHHGQFETSLYIVSGVFRLEHGPGGRDVVEAGPGEFVYVPKQVVHRELNPSNEECTAVITRAGHGEVVINVEGPDPA